MAAIHDLISAFMSRHGIPEHGAAADALLKSLREAGYEFEYIHEREVGAPVLNIVQQLREARGELLSYVCSYEHGSREVTLGRYESEKASCTAIEIAIVALEHQPEAA